MNVRVPVLVAMLCSLRCSLRSGERLGDAVTSLAADGDVVPAQAIACPTYWPPTELLNWEPFKRAAPAASIAIVNWEVTKEYTDAFVRDLQSRGVIVLAYVRTNYMAADV